MSTYEIPPEPGGEEGEFPNEEQEQYLPPSPVYTLILLGSYAAVFIAQLAFGLEHSIEAAAFIKPRFIADHEYWRLLTGATLHGGLLHIVFNSYAFYSFGRISEIVSNRAHLANVFLLSAIAGGALSLLFMPTGTSVGASGGIVGVIGYLAVYSFRRRQFIAPEFRKNMVVNIGFILIFGLVLHDVVDNYAHIGGLAMGSLYALLQVPDDPQTDPRAGSRLLEISGLLSIGIYAAACIYAIVAIIRPF